MVLVDQTKLPQRFAFVACRTHQEVADAIRRMVVRGAPAIGVAAAMGVALAALQSRAQTREELLHDLERAGEVLRGTRPTAVNLSWAVQRVLEKLRGLSGGVGELREAVVSETWRMAEEDVQVNRAMGRVGAALIDDGDTVLTHCRWPAKASRIRVPWPPSAMERR